MEKHNLCLMHYKILYTLLSIFLLEISCNSQPLNYTKETKFGNFRYSKNDIKTINDLIKVTETNLPRICEELSIKFDRLITIEIYPSQEEYNRNIINPGLKNSPAISGNWKIQIVSPLAKIKIDSIKYEDRLFLLVHEYVHVLIDNLDKAPPIFIDEGIACFYSSNGYYKSAAKKYVKRINFIPSIKQLLEHYHELPAPDLFSFLFVDFTVQTKGRKVLKELIRQSNFLTKEEFNKSWQRFIKQIYY